MKFDDLKKGAEDALKKTVDGAKDLANKAANNKIVKDVEKGAEKAVDKTVEGAKDLAGKVTGMFKK